MKSLFLAALVPIVKHVTILRNAREKGPQKSRKLVESKVEVSGVCEAGELRVVTWDQQGARRQRTWPCD